MPSKRSAKPRSRSTGPSLPVDWREFLSLLIARGVRFVLVGGHAVAVHGFPRLTEDLDVYVEPSAPNAERLRSVQNNKRASGRPKDLLDVVEREARRKR
jgi:hypothetical protein